MVSSAIDFSSLAPYLEDPNVLTLLIGTAGVAVLGTVIYGISKNMRSNKQTKKVNFKVIKPPTQGVGLESKRTVAILGATGFVGSNLVDHFIENGQHRVYVLGRRFTDANINLKADAVYQVDMMNYESLEKAFDGIDSVIFSAVITPTVYSNAEDLRKFNILGAQNVLNAAKKMGVRNLILISGIKFAQEQTNKEARALVDAFEHMEDLFTRANRNNNMNACVLAFSQIYGLNSQLYDAIIKGDISRLPLYEYRASFVPVELVAEAAIKAEQKLEEGDNLVAGNILSITGPPSTMREFFTHPSFGGRIGHLPAFIINTAASINRFVAKLTGIALFGVSLSPAMTSIFQADEDIYDQRIPQEALGIAPAPPHGQGIDRMMAKYNIRQQRSS